MKRRNFLKKLGIGVASVPVAIKSLGDQKAEEYHKSIPKYEGRGFDCSEDAGSSSGHSGYIATSDEGFIFIDRFGVTTKLTDEQIDRLNKGCELWQL